VDYSFFYCINQINRSDGCKCIEAMLGFYESYFTHPLLWWSIIKVKMTSVLICYAKLMKYCSVYIFIYCSAIHLHSSYKIHKYNLRLDVVISSIESFPSILRMTSITFLLEKIRPYCSLFDNEVIILNLSILFCHYCFKMLLVGFIYYLLVTV